MQSPAQRVNKRSRRYSTIDRLAPTDPLRAALDGFDRAVGANPDRWFAIANVVAGMRRAKDEGEALAMVWRIKGLLGELLAVSTRSYRQLYKAGLRDARALSCRLNEGMTDEAKREVGKWEVTVQRTQVRAPQVAGSRLAPFYDDVILVRRVKAGVPEGEAIVVFAAQVKCGDWSSAAVIDQIRRDIMREQGGLIELDGRLYRLLPAPNEFPPMRVFVGTLLPPAEAVTTLLVPLDFRILPKGGEDLETIVRGFLEANELLP